MQAGGATTQAVQGVSQAASSPLLVKWLCLCLGRLVEDQPELLSQVRPYITFLYSPLLSQLSPDGVGVTSLCTRCAPKGMQHIPGTSNSILISASS